MPDQYPAALAGWRILDLTDASGAYGVRLLGDLGAEIVKIEPPGGAGARRAWPLVGAGGASPTSLAFVYDNLGKRSVTLDLDSTTGQDLLRRLAGTADALIETFPPGYLSARGLGYPDLAERNPGLVYTSLTPFGQTGPSADFAQMPLTALAMGGLLSTMGFPEGPPVQAGVPLAYLLAGQHAAVFTLIALLGRRLTGRGQHVDVSVQACVAATVEGPLQTYYHTGSSYPRIGAVRALEPPNGTYACRDGYFCFYVLNWPALAEWACRVLGDDELADPKYNVTNQQRAAYAETVIPKIRELCARLTKAELLEGMHRTGQIGAPVEPPLEVLTDPHLASRDFFIEATLLGIGPVRLPGAPYRLSATPWQAPTTAPVAGADNEAILGAELDVEPTDLARLRAAGVI